MKGRLLRYAMMLTVLLCSLCSLCSLAPSADAESTEEIRQLLQEMPLTTCQYSYPSGCSKAMYGASRSGSILYSHALLFQNSNILSPDLVKSSVALAATAYDSGETLDLLSAMGFTPEFNGDNYAVCDNLLTYEDNDYVAYTIAKAVVTHPVSGEEYTIYCVPFRGSTKNLEWFSSFNIGTGNEHEGFRNATVKVLEQLVDHFAEDGSDKNHRILWLTGHSRGAACANLLAGWFSNEGYPYVAKERMFTYTFACPEVSKTADGTLDNIFNFNNHGDMLSLIPMPEMNFDRYGQTYWMDVTSAEFDQFNRRFTEELSLTYVGETDDGNYRPLLSDVSKSDEPEEILELMAVWLSGGDMELLDQVVGKHAGELVGSILWDIIQENFDLDKVVDLLELVTIAVGADNQQLELIQWCEDALHTTNPYTSEEFDSYLQTHADQIRKVQDITGMTIVTRSDLEGAYEKLQFDRINLTRFIACLRTAVELVYDGNGWVSEKVNHAHMQLTYHTWINCKYYGYYGRAKDPAATTATLDDTYFSIGQGCFSDCVNLTGIQIPDTICSIGENAFANCTSATSAVLPADLRYGAKAFLNTANVETVHYTPGTTGVMVNRVPEYLKENYYQYALEHYSADNLCSITFAEGITHIADYLCYYGLGEDRAALKTVSLPSTLESIGQRAFAGCVNLETPDWPAKLTGIGGESFSRCLKLTSHPTTLTVFSISCFSGCTGIPEIVIPDTVSRIEDYAFSSCTGATSITLPADLSYGAKAFENTCNLETIRYTPGTTGVMPDRVYDTDYTKETCYRNAPEHHSALKLRSIVFDEGITHVAAYLCYYELGAQRAALESVTLPSTLKSIGERAFYNCTNLETPDWPAKLTGIGGESFSKCLKLTSHPATLTVFPTSCFSGCTGIQKIVLSDTVSRIEDYAFSSCTGVTSITLPADLSYGAKAFENVCNVETIRYTPGTTGVMPDRVGESGYLKETYYRNAPEHRSALKLRSIVFDEGITHIAAYLCYYDMGAKRPGLESVTLPSTLESLGTQVFYNCTNLGPLTFRGDAPAIGSSAFYGVTTTCYYPAVNSNWTGDVRQNYGGNLTWEPLSCTGEHSYGAPAFTWIQPGECQATAACSSCGQEQTFPCSVTSATVPPTSTQNGTVTYTASVTLGGRTYTDTMVVAALPGEHVPDGGQYTDHTHHWQICAICGEKLNVAEHIPGPEAKENTSRKCTVCGRILQLPLGLDWVMDIISDPDSGFWASGYYAKIMEQYGAYLN